MHVKDKGPIPWLGWALFSWKGKIKRLPYAVAFVILTFLGRFYPIIVVPLVAQYIYPPADGAQMSVEYIKSLAANPLILLFYTPLLYVYMVLDIKRLRSIEISIALATALAALFAAASLASPILVPQYAQQLSLSIFCYHAILAVLPAKEDRISPYERKYRVWRAIANGKGDPVRLSGKAIKHWHIVSQNRAKNT